MPVQRVSQTPKRHSPFIKPSVTIALALQAAIAFAGPVASTLPSVVTDSPMFKPGGATKGLTPMTAGVSGSAIYTYDALGRLKNVAKADGIVVITYNYDASGNRTTVVTGL